MTNTARKPKVSPESVRVWLCGSTTDCRLLLQLRLPIPLAPFLLVRSSPLGAVRDGPTPAAPSAETANSMAAKGLDRANDIVGGTSAVALAMLRLMADGIVGLTIRFHSA